MDQYKTPWSERSWLRQVISLLKRSALTPLFGRRSARAFRQQTLRLIATAERAGFWLIAVNATVPKSMKTAYATIKGFEVMRMIRKRQCILLEPGATGEVRFVNKLFGLAA
jgi:hypothetical protein